MPCRPTAQRKSGGPPAGTVSHGRASPGTARCSRAVIRLRGRRGSPGLAACRRRKHKRACTRPGVSGHDLNNFFFFATKQFARDSWRATDWAIQFANDAVKLSQSMMIDYYWIHEVCRTLSPDSSKYMPFLNWHAWILWQFVQVGLDSTLESFGFKFGIELNDLKLA